MMPYSNTPLPMIAIICFALLPTLVYSWQIQNGGSILSSTSTSLEEYQNDRITPPNIHSPDYYHPIAYGGKVQSSGEDGMVVLTTNIGNSNDTPMVIKSNYFMKENVIQEYIIPGNNNSSPYEQQVTMKLWGGGGGGCNGGRGVSTSPSPEEDDGIVRFNQGRAGGYVEATFSLPIGDKLYIVAGGGGKSEGSLSNSLAGKGGWHGGLDGRSDLSSGGGGGGGFTSVSWNSTVVAAAFGGDGGGNTTYCKAQGGAGGVLRGKNKDSGGYINFDSAVNDNVIKEEVICPGILEIETLSHDSATLTWNAGTHKHKTTKEYYVQKFTVQLAEGIVNNEEDTEGIVCSDEDYRLHEHIQRGVDVNRNTTTHVNNLQSSTPYCIRVEAFSIEGLSLGVQVKHFTTKSTPVNNWHQVTVRQRAVSTTSEVAVNSDASTTDSFCQHSSSLPTGRRGHSMTVINDNVYVYGGATLKCICNIDETTKEKVCKSMNGYSDELWHFDPITSIFTQLDNESEHDDWPRSREQHSMTALPNGNLVLIGGISSSNDNSEIGEDSSELLSDVWIMKDPHHVSSHVFSMDEHESLELEAGQVTSHVLPISLSNEMDEDMCVSDIQVKIALDHSCPKGIQYIKLTAPEVIDNHVLHQSRDYETKLFVGSMASREHECLLSSIDLLFTDDAHDDSVLSRASIPMSGTFRSADSLMQTFGDLPVDGDWTLSIGMSQPTYPEVYEGTLNDWKVIVDVKPCSTHPKWEKLASPPLTFEPRRLHTAIAVDNSIFISGGFAQGRLTDMWRFDYDTNTWTELRSQGMQNAWPMYGQAAYIGEFGLMSYGGLAPRGPRTPGEDLWLWDIFEWTSLPIAQNNTLVHDDQRLSNDIPQGRYLSTIGLLDNAHFSSEGPSVLVFGGDNGLLHNSHHDSYGYMSSSFLDDVWLLSPDGMYISSPMKNGNHHEEYCTWMMKDWSTAEQVWNDSCGWEASMEEASPPDECNLKDVLIVAWCRKQYQSLTVS